MKRQSVSEILAPRYDAEMEFMRRLSLPSVVIEDPHLLPQDDLTVQIHHDDGHWHRRAIGGERTGCGDPLARNLGGPGFVGNGLRNETYLAHEGPLCRRGCFSPWELEKSAEDTALFLEAQRRKDELAQLKAEADAVTRRAERDALVSTFRPRKKTDGE